MEGHMRRNALKMTGVALLLAVPAVALADATTYSGDIDGSASIELKITDGDDRKVKKVVARKLQYLSSATNCVDTGRTGKIVVRDSWRVKGNGEFRVVGNFDGGSNPLNGGQLNVVGDAGRNKVTGTVKFTYGKTGCQTEKVAFEATR